MNESEFEDELRGFHPIEPSTEISAAVARELTPAPARATCPPAAGIIPRPQEGRASRILTGLCWAMGGAAIAVLVFMFGPDPHHSGSVAANNSARTPAVSRPDDGFQRTVSSREVIREENGGLYFDTNHQPEQMLRYSSVERHIWTNPATGARVKVEVPREDVVLIPVSFQ